MVFGFQVEVKVKWKKKIEGHFKDFQERSDQFGC